MALVVGVELLGDDELTLAMVAALPLVVLISKAVGLYDRDRLVMHKTTLDEAPALLSITALYTLILWLAEAAFVDGDLGRRQVLGLWITLLVLVVVGRVVARHVGLLVTPVERCLVVGEPEDARRISAKLASSKSVRAEPIAQLPIERVVDGFGSGRISNLEELIGRDNIDRVVIAPDGSDPAAVLELVSSFAYLGVKVSVIPRLLEVVGSNTHLDEFDDVSLLGVGPPGLTKSSRVLKRCMDVIGATVALALLAPVLTAIAVAVRVSSPGPVLYRQPRVGRNGEHFEILKFRTMEDGADEDKAELDHLNEADGLFKIADDPRITRVGRGLRRVSLDELPQLFNVLRGQMSLVGPRPLIEPEDRQVTGSHRRRLELGPGITGPWQVRGSARIPLRDMVAIDYMYVANWSLWNDIKIMLRTVTFVLSRRGL